jgi:hypothetical protein
MFWVLPFVVLSSQTLHSPEMAGQASLRPNPDAFPVEVCPPICSHHCMLSDAKA